MKQYDRYIHRYLKLLHRDIEKWHIIQAEILELTFLSKFQRIRMTYNKFKHLVDSLASSEGIQLRADDAKRLWIRWKAFFSDENVLDDMKLRMKIIERDGNLCRYCKSDGSSRRGLQLHHVFPKDKGGASTLENVIFACGTCNDKIGKEIEFPRDWKFGIVNAR